jgi:hypothetical protein
MRSETKKRKKKEEEEERENGYQIGRLGFANSFE